MRGRFSLGGRRPADPFPFASRQPASSISGSGHHRLIHPLTHLTCHATARQLKKGELLDNVVKKAGVTKVMADKVISALTESIAESLTDGKKGGCVWGA